MHDIPSHYLINKLYAFAYSRLSDVLTRLTYMFQINNYGCFMYKKSKERVNCGYIVERINCYSLCSLLSVTLALGMGIKGK
jgi:hypothetical protein